MPVCRLPSPIWPYVTSGSPCLRPISWIFLSMNGHLLDWHADVLRLVYPHLARVQPGDRDADQPPGGPEPFFLVLVLRDHGFAAEALADLADFLRLPGDRLFIAVHLEQQHCLDVRQP